MRRLLLTATFVFGVASAGGCTAPPDHVGAALPAPDMALTPAHVTFRLRSAQ